LRLEVNGAVDYLFEEYKKTLPFRGKAGF
jgi:hypothetical protein